MPSILATSLAAFIALPTVADGADTMDSVRPTTTLPHQRDELLRRLPMVGPAVAISLLTILGLTIGLPALRRDMRQRRSAYRRRGRREQRRP